MIVTIKLNGMSCAACANAVEKALNIDGVKKAEASFAGGCVSIEYNDEIISLAEIERRLKKAGYPPAVKGMETEERSLSTLILSIAIAIILAIYAMAPMFGTSVPFYDDASVYGIIQAVLCFIVLILGRGFFIKGIPSLLRRTPTMDTLISIGSGTAFVYSLYLTIGSFFFSVEPMFYYDSSAMIVALVSVGKYMESRSKVKADDAVSRLLSLAPDKAVIVVDEEEKTIDSSLLKKGDIVVVRPGERVPADGVVVDGFTSMDESMLTGESVPVDKTVGCKIYAGSMNTDGWIRFEVDDIGDGMFVSKIAKLMDDAKTSKAPIARAADSAAAVFVPFVISVSLISLIAWSLIGEYSKALTSMISVLVISCPCALGLATPMAVAVGSGRAAEYGILFRNAAALEHCGRTDAVVFDKTGTLTFGLLNVDSYDGDDKSLSLALAGEKLSNHPIAVAIVNYCSSKNVESVEIKDFSYVPGKGMYFNYENKKIEISSEKTCSNDGRTGVSVKVDGIVKGTFLLSDTVRPESGKATDSLKRMGVSVSIVSGDGEGAVNAVADAVGIDDHMFAANPIDKIDYIKDLQTVGKTVLMAGDGINDSPALAQADVGMAMGAGSDIAISSADAIVLNEDVESIPNAISFGRRTLAIIKQNLFFAFCYNIVCIPIAAGLPYLFGAGDLQYMPMAAAAAMSLSSLSVVTNALRLRKYEPDHLHSETASGTA